MHDLSGCELYEGIIAIDPLLKACSIAANNISEFDEFGLRRKLTSNCFVNNPLNSDLLLATVKKVIRIMLDLDMGGAQY